MLEIEVNAIVLETLKQCFPKPKNAAQKSLDKYIKLLTQQMTKSILLGRNAWMQSNDLYSISVAKQRNRGSQIGSNKIRLQNWLEDNNLELFSVVEIGSNLNQKLSVIKLTQLVTVKHTDTHITSIHDIETEELRKLLKLQSLSNQEIYKREYPNIDSLTDEEVNSAYDMIRVDMKSLSYYLTWLKHESKFISTEKKQIYELQADTILRIAQHTNGYFLQEKKASAFGRNYYVGTSVQNVNKELRRAMLGNCYEYDLRSAVFTWKYGFARECYETLDTTETFEKTFAQSRLFLDDKNDFYMTVRYYTFDDECELSREQKDKMLKQAITAIGFGARRGTHGFMLNSGKWKNPALVEIFKYHPQARDKFLNCSIIKDFLREQNLIDTYLFESCKASNADFLRNEEVRNFSGSLSKAKVIAYLYQHSETVIMDYISEELEKRGFKVLARVHDAIFVKNRLGESKHEIEHLLQSDTENKYWHLTMKELKAYERPYCLDSAEIDAHRKRIAEEELHAKSVSKTQLMNYSWTMAMN
jgi:predicted RNA-binding protein YlxR (DUF448 family)